MSSGNRDIVWFALMWWRCREVICCLLFCGSQLRSHYHLQGQGRGGGAACGEGGHYHLRVDGILPLLWVHAQHRHLRQGQVAGMMVVLEAWGRLGLVYVWPTGRIRLLTHKHTRQWWSRGFTVLLRAWVCCPDSEVIMNDLVSNLGSCLQALNLARDLIWHARCVNNKDDGWPLCVWVYALILEAFLVFRNLEAWCSLTELLSML